MFFFLSVVDRFCFHFVIAFLLSPGSFLVPSTTIHCWYTKIIKHFLFNHHQMRLTYMLGLAHSQKKKKSFMFVEMYFLMWSSVDRQTREESLSQYWSRQTHNDDCDCFFRAVYKRRKLMLGWKTENQTHQLCFLYTIPKVVGMHLWFLFHFRPLCQFNTVRAHIK